MYIHLYHDRNASIYLRVETDRHNLNPAPILNWATENNFKLNGSMGGICIDDPAQIKSFLTMLNLNIQAGKISPHHLSYQDSNSFFFHEAIIMVDAKVKLSTLLAHLQDNPVTVKNFQQIKDIVDNARAHKPYLNSPIIANSTSQDPELEDNNVKRHCSIM